MHKLKDLSRTKGEFRHTWFHHKRDVEGCTISKTPELRRFFFSATKFSS